MLNSTYSNGTKLNVIYKWKYIVYLYWRSWHGRLGNRRQRTRHTRWRQFHQYNTQIMNRAGRQTTHRGDENGRIKIIGALQFVENKMTRTKSMHRLKSKKKRSWKVIIANWTTWKIAMATDDKERRGDETHANSYVHCVHVGSSSVRSKATMVIK